jgi:hypothetical protein
MPSNHFASTSTFWAHELVPSRPLYVGVSYARRKVLRFGVIGTVDMVVMVVVVVWWVAMVAMAKERSSFLFPTSYTSG